MKGRNIQMDTLTKTQLARQDFVDNAIYDLLQEINPSKEKIDWDIEVIGEIRDIIQFYLWIVLPLLMQCLSIHILTKKTMKAIEYDKPNI